MHQKIVILGQGGMKKSVEGDIYIFRWSIRVKVNH